jgi:cellobiose transport system permease protein
MGSVGFDRRSLFTRNHSDSNRDSEANKLSTKVHISTKHETRAGYAFLSPFFILFGIFGLLPILFTIYVSFFNWDLLGTQEWVGFNNYIELFQDSRFYQSLGNTISIFLLSSVPQLISALLLAIVLNSKSLKLRTFWRAVILFPFITSTVAVAVVFGAMFADNGGMMNWALGFLGIGPVAWHADALAGQIVIALMVNWRWTGYNTLIFLAALQSIPAELYEAAEMDGASKISQFFNITIPQIRPTIFFTVVTSTIGGLQIFAEPMQFGGGNYGGGSEGQFSTMTLFLFDQAFAQLRLGYSSAIAIGLFLIIAVIAGINFLLSNKLVKADS